MIIEVTPDSRIQEGQALTLTCIAHGVNPPDLRYKWYFKEKYKNKGIELDEKSAHLEVTNSTSPRHAGLYMCQVSAGSHVLEGSKEITVLCESLL